jgi:hypothetical protein
VVLIKRFSCLLGKKTRVKVLKQKCIIYIVLKKDPVATGRYIAAGFLFV